MSGIKYITLGVALLAIGGLVWVQSNSSPSLPDLIVDSDQSVRASSLEQTRQAAPKIESALDDEYAADIETFMIGQAERDVANDPLMQFEANEDSILDVDSVTPEERLFAEATANMTESEFDAYRRLTNHPLVRDANGRLKAPYAQETICNDEEGDGACEVVIINQQTKAVIYDGQWTAGFQPTGFKQEVVKVTGRARRG